MVSFFFEIGVEAVCHTGPNQSVLEQQLFFLVAINLGHEKVWVAYAGNALHKSSSNSRSLGSFSQNWARYSHKNSQFSSCSTSVVKLRKPAPRNKKNTMLKNSFSTNEHVDLIDTKENSCEPSAV